MHHYQLLMGLWMCILTVQPLCQLALTGRPATAESNCALMKTMCSDSVKLLANSFVLLTQYFESSNASLAHYTEDTNVILNLACKQHKMFFCSFTCHNKNPFLSSRALLCLWSHPVKACEWQISFFHRSSEWKRAFWNAQDRGVWSPWSPVCLSMSQSIGGWPWISWWGGGCFCFHGRWGPLSLSLSLSLSVSRKCRKHKPHWACCAFGRAVACSEAAVRPESHSLGGLALQMFMI